MNTWYVILKLLLQATDKLWNIRFVWFKVEFYSIDFNNKCFFWFTVLIYRKTNFFYNSIYCLNNGLVKNNVRNWIKISRGIANKNDSYSPYFFIMIKLEFFSFFIQNKRLPTLVAVISFNISQQTSPNFSFGNTHPFVIMGYLSTTMAVYVNSDAEKKQV